MVLMVPDEPDESLETPGGESDAAQQKAKLDDTEVSRASQKVDLDLDDAPFLEEEEEEEEILEEEPIAPPPELEEKPKKEPPAWLRNKLLIVGLLVGLLIGGGVFYFLSGPSAPPPPPPAPQQQPAEPAPAPAPETPAPEGQPAPEEQAPVGESLVRLDPFLIEQRDGEGQLRFLEVSLVFSTPDPALAANLTRETPTVRYALYYYMKNKDLQFLTDEKNTEDLKKELLSVVNQYMSAGRFETVLFEEYLVR